MQTKNTQLGGKERSIMDLVLFAPSNSLYAASSQAAGKKYCKVAVLTISNGLCKQGNENILKIPLECSNK